jgi:hypothetical protein
MALYGASKAAAEIFAKYAAMGTPRQVRMLLRSGYVSVSALVNVCACDTAHSRDASVYWSTTTTQRIERYTHSLYTL